MGYVLIVVHKFLLEGCNMMTWFCALSAISNAKMGSRIRVAPMSTGGVEPLPGAYILLGQAVDP